MLLDTTYPKHAPRRTKLLTTNMAGSQLGLTVLINPSLKDQQPGLGLNNYFGTKVTSSFFTLSYNYFGNKVTYFFTFNYNYNYFGAKVTSFFSLSYNYLRAKLNSFFNRRTNNWDIKISFHWVIFKS